MQRDDTNQFQILSLRGGWQRPECLSSSLFEYFHAQRVWGMGQGGSMLKEADPQVVEGVSGQWGLSRGRTLGVSSRVRKKES